MLRPSLIHRGESVVGIAMPTVSSPELPTSPLSPQAVRDRDRAADRAAATVMRTRMVIFLVSDKSPHRTDSYGSYGSYVR
jgi:hypothetical protein